MTNLMRAALWVVWLAVVGWLWYAGDLGVVAALGAAAASLLLLAIPVTAHRRRRSTLQYVQMVKRPRW